MYYYLIDILNFKNLSFNFFSQLHSAPIKLYSV